MHWKIGSVPIGGVVEVSEFDPARDLAWIGISGVRCGAVPDPRQRRRPHEGHFPAGLRIGGNLLGLIADRVAARQVGRNMSATLKNLKRMVES